ncbi:MAG: tryptophan synthase subunit alpha [Actinomycetota bacterium]|nr:tryptophan synthase subunit alpha [Actinomycetota bacterium]
MTRLRATLESARLDGRAAVVGYLPAGFPDRARYFDLVEGAFTAGLDALEIGLPGPAPTTEGVAITAAINRCRGAVTGLQDALTLAAEARAHAQDALIALAYDVVVDEVGIDGLLDSCRAAEIDSVLLPQLSMNSQLEIARQAQAEGIDVVFFLSRREEIGQLSDGGVRDPIIYLQSATQHTGGTFNPGTASERLADVRSAFGARSARVLVGFGIASPLDVQVLVRAGADGVVVGTAFVEAADRGGYDLDQLVVALRSAAVADPRSTAGRPA